jgi:hypothetical protein
VRRRKGKSSKKMSLKGGWNFVSDHITALEAIGAMAIGLVAGLKLPGWIEQAVSKATGRSVNLTSGRFRPFITGAVCAGAAAYVAYSLNIIGYQTASAIALAGVAVNGLNLIASFNVPYVPSVGLSGGGYRPFGYLGSAHDDVLAMKGFGDHQGYEDSNTAFFGGSSTREMNFY